MRARSNEEDVPLPEDLCQSLAERGVQALDETTLRRELERRVPGYNLFRLTPAASRRWKCRYRLLLEAGYFDGHSVAEVYGRALLAALTPAPAATDALTPPAPPRQ
jgi:hypothetical protein